jgi:hypothetical protein
MELPILPREFSRQARKRIIDAEITASRALAKSEPHLRSFYVSSHSSGNWQVLELYVLPVFLAFAKETCAMSQHKPEPWYSDLIDRVVREFLRKLLVAVRGEYDRPDYPVFAMTSDSGGYGYVRPEAKDIIEKSAEWKTYQDLLLTVEHPSESAETDAISDLSGISEPFPDQDAGDVSTETLRRRKLLAGYKDATGQPSNRKIYTAKNSGIHKPEFYDWINGKLEITSQTCINFERFLKEQKPPLPRKPTRT